MIDDQDILKHYQDQRLTADQLTAVATQTPNLRRSWVRPFAVAACVLVLLAVGLFAAQYF